MYFKLVIYKETTLLTRIRVNYYYYYKFENYVKLLYSKKYIAYAFVLNFFLFILKILCVKKNYFMNFCKK